jgi:CRP/FNR family transcriptional regulator, cyclic AMP receptor protein
MSRRSIIIKKTSNQRRFDPALFFETAAKGRAIAKHRKGEIIFSQGDAADAVFYIKKGKIKVTVVSKQGKEAVVAILGTDEFVGEGCLIGQPKRLATASALSECVTMRVDKTEIQRLLRTSLRFLRCLFRTFWRERPVWKKTWLTSYSTPQRSGLLDCCCC